MRKQRNMSDKPARRGPGRPRVEGREPKTGNPIYAFRLNREDTQWVKDRGGPKYLQRLIRKDQERVSRCSECDAPTSLQFYCDTCNESVCIDCRRDHMEEKHYSSPADEHCHCPTCCVPED